MPAPAQPPTLRDFGAAYADAIRGSRSTTADVRVGSAYDLAGGVSAVVWSRLAQRDKRLFRQCYTLTADGEDLERHVEQKYLVQREQARHGTGTLTLTRPVAGAAGPIYAGTRVEYVPGSTAPVPYVVAQDTTIPASALAYPIPVRASRTGPGTAVNAGPAALRLTDAVFDSTLVPTALVCGEGTDQEPPEAYIARARQTRTDARNGFQTRIVNRLEEAGADQVVLLDARSLGAAHDYALSYAYVADSGYSTPATLQRACAVALDEVISAGTDVQVLGMVLTPVAMSVSVALLGDPGGYDLADLKLGVTSALVEEFARRKAWWWFRNSALAGLAQRTSPVIQSVVVTTTPAEPAVTFPDVLPRYVLNGTDIAVTFTGPV